MSDGQWRERLRQKRRAQEVERRAALAADPRLQRIKVALEERFRAVDEAQRRYIRERADARKRRRAAHGLAPSRIG